jgi:hypothetical protein
MPMASSVRFIIATAFNHKAPCAVKRAGIADHIRDGISNRSILPAFAFPARWQLNPGRTALLCSLGRYAVMHPFMHSCPEFGVI